MCGAKIRLGCRHQSGVSHVMKHGFSQKGMSGVFSSSSSVLAFLAPFGTEHKLSSVVCWIVLVWSVHVV